MCPSCIVGKDSCMPAYFCTFHDRTEHSLLAMLKDRYLWLCFALTLFITSFFLGDVLRAPNNFHFSSGGDGLQTYYQSIYHVKHDSTYLHQQGLNYPYGESIFFTGGQPLTSNLVKWMKPVVDLSDYMVGITNLMMLIGIFICPIFLYLLFKELGVELLFAVLFAVGLTFITQQWERFGGHYPLAYLYAIPGMIYFLLLFYKRPSWKWSVIIAAYVMFLVFAHIYYVIFFGVIAFAFWMVFVVFNRHRAMPTWKSLLHLSVQLILPFIILQLLIHASSDVVDRTAIPWGFMVYRASIASYLFPYGLWYEHLFEVFRPQLGAEWEGLGYVGGAAMLLFVVEVFFFLFAFKKFYGNVLRWENKFFLSLLISSILCVAVSFAFPFNYDLDKLLYQLGPIQQFRGIGRFAFVAFYLMNVLVISLFWKLPIRTGWLRWALASLMVVLMGSEAYTRMDQVSSRLRNERNSLLRSGELTGLESIDFHHFQAMIPYPFFHIGSENVGALCDGDLMNHVFDISVKTGLPTFAAAMSRTSISQSFNNMALSKEIMEIPGVINDVSNEKPVLLVCDTLNMAPHQKQLLRFARLITSHEKFVYYEMPLAGFEQQLLANRAAINAMKPEDYYLSSNEMHVSNASDSVFYDPTFRQIKLEYQWKRYVDLDVPTSWQGRKMLLSFWIKDFQQDLVPRTSLEVVQKNGDEVTGYLSQYMDGRYVGTRKGSALIEYHIDFDSSTTHLQMSFQNKLLQGHVLECSDLIIRPEGVDCLILRPDFRSYNNRIY